MKLLIGTILLMCLAQTITGNYVKKIHDPSKLLDAMDTIKEVLVYDPTTPYEKDALEVYMYLRRVFTNYTVEKFTKSIASKTGGFYAQPMVIWREKIYNYNNDLYRQIIKKTIYNVFPLIDETTLFELFNYETPHLKFIGYTAIFETLKTHPIMKETPHKLSTWFKYAMKLKEFVKPFLYTTKNTISKISTYQGGYEQPSTEFGSTTGSIDYLYDIEYLKNLLPAGLKSMVFDQVVCVRNAAYNSYLFVDYTRTEDRPVFGQKQQYPIFSDNMKFIIELQLDYTFRLKNALYNKYLYASPTIPKMESTKSQYYNRTVALYTTGGKPEEETPITGSRWEFTILFDNVYIKSVAYNEYLLMGAPIEYGRSPIFTTNELHNHELYLPAVWSFEDCE